jgi:hypothetical protein
VKLYRDEKYLKKMARKSTKPTRPQDKYWGSDVWEARSHDFGDEKDSIWLVCITCCHDDLFLTRTAFETKPTPKSLWEVLFEGMDRPEYGERRSPSVLVAMANQGWKSLTRKLAKIGELLVITDDLDYPDGFPEWTSWVCEEWEKNGRKLPNAQQY